MRRFLVWTLGLLAALVVAVLLLLIFPPTGWIANRIEEVVAARTGYALEIGDLDLDLLSATPSATVSSVSVDGGQLPGLLDAGRAEVAIDLGAALGGELVVDRILVADAEVRVLRTADGRVSWTPGTVEEAAKDVAEEPLEPDGGELVLPTIRELRIGNLAVVVDDEITGTEAMLGVQASGSTLPDETPLNVAVEGTANGAPVRADLALGSPLGDVVAGGPVQLALDASTDGADIALAGSVAEPGTLGGVNLALDVDVESLDAIGTIVGAELPALAPATLAATLRSEGEDLVLAADGTAAGEPVRAALALDLQGPLLEALAGGEPLGVDLDAAAGGARVGLIGRVGNPAALGDVDLALDVDIESLAALETVLGTELPALAPATLAATVRSDADGYVVAADGTVDGEPVTALLDLDASLDQLRAGGPVTLDLDAAVGGAKLGLAGSVDDVATLGGADLALEADIDSLDAVGKLIGRDDLPAFDSATLSATVRSDADGGNLAVRADGEVDGESIDASLDLDSSIEDVLAGEPVALDLDASVGGASVSASGRIDDIRTLENSDLDLDVDIDSLAAVERLLGTELPALEPASLAATVKSEGESTTLEAEGTIDGAPVDATLALESSVEGLLAGEPVALDLDAAAGGATVRLDGRVEDPAALSGVDLALDADIESLAAIETLLDTELPDIEPASLEATLLTEGDEYVVRRFDLAAADSTLQGDVRVNPTTEPVTVYANLVSRRLDVDAVLVALGIEGEEDAAADEDDAGAGDEAEAEVEGPVLSTEPLPVDALFGAAQGAVALRVEELVYAAVPLESFDARVELTPEAATVTLADVALAGGDVEGTLALESVDGGSSLDAKLDLDLSRVGVGRFLPEVELVDDAGGPLGGQVELWASGNSVATLAGSLDGGASLLMGRGRLDAVLVELAGLDLVQSVGDLLDPGEEEFRLRCAYASLFTEDGLLSIDEFVLDSEDTVFLAEGTVDLGTETIDVSLEPYPKDPSILAASTSVRVGGSFAAPAFETGPELPLRTAAAAVLAAVATPAAALLPLIETGGGEDSGFCELEGALDGDAG